MSERVKEGRCLGCDSDGTIGEPCTQVVCRKFSLHFIPEQYHARFEAASRTDRDPLIGTRVGDYLVVGVVGRGGFAHVFLVLQLPELMECALKLMRATYQSHDKAETLLRKFRGEAEALASLKHPNIVRLIRSGTLNGIPYIIMEYADAVSLRDEIERRRREGIPFSRRAVLTMFDQICFGLQAAHDEQIVHRDIKPDNILLQEVSGHPLLVRIVDFGLARFVKGTTNTQALFGTPAYMAPELMGKGEVSLASDTYALAKVLFEVLLLQPIMHGNTIPNFTREKVENALSQMNLSGIAGLEEPLVSFFAKALKFLPEDRFQTAEEFRQALHFTMGENPTALPEVQLLASSDAEVRQGPLGDVWEDIRIQDTLTNPEFKASPGSSGREWIWFVLGISALILAVGLSTWLLVAPLTLSVPSNMGAGGSPAVRIADGSDKGLEAVAVVPVGPGPDTRLDHDRLTDSLDYTSLPALDASLDIGSIATLRDTWDSAPGTTPWEALGVAPDTPRRPPSPHHVEADAPPSKHNRATDVMASAPDRRDLSPAALSRDIASGEAQSGRISGSRKTETRRRHRLERDARHGAGDVLGHPAAPPPQPVTFEVMVDSPQADVAVHEGERVLGRTPLSITVLRGYPRSVVLRKQGYEDYELTLTGARSTIQVELKMTMW